MKKIKNIQKNNFLKKIFVKLCRLFGFEIIDQSTFKSPTLEKDLNETLNVTQTPLSQLQQDVLCPGSKILEEINQSLS